MRIGSVRWSECASGRVNGAGGAFEYTVGWDRLSAYEDVVMRRLRSHHLSCLTLYLEDGFWSSELRLLEARGNVAVSASGHSTLDYVPDAARGAIVVTRYRPAPDAHLHVKLDLFEDGAANSFVRLTTAHLATRRLGPIVLGMRGFGRTELYFLTDHPGIVSEATALERCIRSDRLPASGAYLRLETPLENRIYPSLCEDIRSLQLGYGRIVHYRTNYYDGIWKAGQQEPDGLLELHVLMKEYARRGTETLVGYGEPDEITQEVSRRHAEAGAHIGIPRYMPGSFTMPFGLTKMLKRVPSLRGFKLAEHVNVTIIDGLRESSMTDPYAVVYLGHKSDLPYDRTTLELMVRCDTREFPGLAAGVSRLIDSRLRVTKPAAASREAVSH